MMPRTLLCLALLGGAASLRRRGPLAVTRGGGRDVGIEQLEDLVDVVEDASGQPLEDPADDDDEEPPRTDDAWRTLVSIWKGRLEHGVEDAHPSRERFASELNEKKGNATSRLLAPQRAATLLGTARMAFRRRSLAPHLRRLPRCSAGLRLRCEDAPPAVHEALAIALADASGARCVIVDEAQLKRVRKLAIERSHAKGRGPSRERLVRALLSAARDADEPVVVVFRDAGGCVFRSRGACRACLDELRDDRASTLLVFLATAEVERRPQFKRAPQQQQQRPLPPPPSIRDEGFDADATLTGGNETKSFEGALRDLARRVAAQARKAADDEELDGRGREYLAALEEALSDEGLVQALADQCAPLLDDPGVAVHVALSIGRPVPADGQVEAPQTALEATLDARPPEAPPSGSPLRVPASLMRWMGLTPREEPAPPPQKKRDADEDPARALAEALDDVLVGPPQGATAGGQWAAWLRDEVRLSTRETNGRKLAAHLRRSALDADLEKLGHLLGSRILTDEDCRRVALDALKVELAKREPRYSSDVLELAPASLALALAGTANAPQEIQEEQLDKHEKALMASVVKPSDVAVAFDAIGGLDEAKKALREAITYPLKYPALYEAGVAREACKGVLLFGPPGTGKTMLAKAVATEGGAAFLAIDASAIENKWLGESEKNAKAVFALARRLAPCVIFLDEVDAMLSSREGGDDTAHGTLTSVKTTLMQEWDGLRTTQDRVVVIGSTNRPYDLDEAVLRRMPRRILVDLPDKETREAILRVTLRENVVSEDVDLGVLARRLEGYSGSDVKEVCREAIVAISHEHARVLDAQSAADELDGACAAALDPPPLRPACMADFEKAIERLSASVAETGPEMSKVLEWNAQYGEVKKKGRAAPSSLYL